MIRLEKAGPGRSGCSCTVAGNGAGASAAGRAAFARNGRRFAGGFFCSRRGVAGPDGRRHHGGCRRRARSGRRTAFGPAAGASAMAGTVCGDHAAVADGKPAARGPARTAVPGTGCRGSAATAVAGLYRQ